MRITRLLLGGILCVASLAAAQVQVPAGCLTAPHKLPDDLRSSLEERLSTFLAAQAEERWDDVSALLGRCRFGCEGGGFYYTGSYKQCLVSRMQEVRMLDFSTHDLFTCSTKLELPPGTVDRIAVEQLPWYLEGTARFQSSAKTWTDAL